MLTVNNCWLDYCNANNLHPSLCGGSLCTTLAHSEACRNEWVMIGSSIATRIQKPTDCTVKGNHCYLTYCNASADLKTAHCAGNTCTTAK